MWVVKLGGSLANDAATLRKWLEAAATHPQRPLIIVPGGGHFANAVRHSQAALGFSDPLAHRLALAAMAHFGQVLLALEPRLVTCRGNEFGSLGGSGAYVWLPDSAQGFEPPVAENWSLTSDSLALWVAMRTQAPCCVLVKSVAPPSESDSIALLSLSGYVDRAFPDYAHRYAGEIIFLASDAYGTLADIARRSPRHGDNSSAM